MPTLIHGGPIFTDNGFQDGLGLVFEGTTITSVAPAYAFNPDLFTSIDLKGNRLVPGFTDIQVNGGGGVLLNDQPSVDGIRTIMKAHRQFGTTGMLPTLISDTPEVTARAIMAVDAAIDQGVPGILGIHLEGPFLTASKKGIHDPSTFRVLDRKAVDLICSLKNGKTLVTLAPEQTTPEVIRELVGRGVIVAAGHTNASYSETRTALDAGLSCFTHLFNAMSPLTSREPGVVGAALEDENSYCGIIIDGFHVAPASARIAMKAKPGDRMILVTDAMPGVGLPDTASQEKTFPLQGRTITVRNGKCTAEDGTLAGSDLDMGAAVRNTVDLIGIPAPEAIRMASKNPACLLGLDDRIGRLAPTFRATMLEMAPDYTVRRTWIDGIPAMHP